eukprot:1026368-Pelagomonas_calceolata.AAC.7
MARQQVVCEYAQNIAGTRMCPWQVQSMCHLTFCASQGCSMEAQGSRWGGLCCLHLQMGTSAENCQVIPRINLSYPSTKLNVVY